MLQYSNIVVVTLSDFFVTVRITSIYYLLVEVVEAETESKYCNPDQLDLTKILPNTRTIKVKSIKYGDRLTRDETAGPDLASPNSQTRTGTGKYSFSLLFS